MKVCILNGSPKSKYSITLQTSLYLEKLNKDTEVEIVHAGNMINFLEKDFSKVIQAVEKADLIVFSYPVYTCIAPYQTHKLIELLKKANLDLTGKFATQITTSKKFYDMTAHKYIEQNCYDLGLKYIQGLTADMDDLTTEKGQKEAVAFWNCVKNSVKNNVYEVPKIVEEKEVPYVKAFEEIEKKDIGKKTVIVTNCEDNDTNLIAMIEDFQNKYPYESKVINIAKYPMKGGCLGCFACASDGECVYKDGFDKFLREEILTNDVIIYAFTVKDHSMGATFKRYEDRQFCNGHRTVTMGMPIGYIVNGNYGEEDNLKVLLEARSSVGHNYLSGIATDSESMELMIKKLDYAILNNYVTTQNFYGIGGMKIFRDLIYVMRGLMKADHKFYKKKGFYDDLPQKQKGRMVMMILLGGLAGNKKMRKKMGNKMNEGMVAPYRKVINKLDK